MNARTWLFILGIFAMGVGMPVLVAYNLRLGEFAKSPQTVELMLGSSILVAGGRAKIWFAQVDMGPTIEINCRKETRMVELQHGEPTDEICGVRVELIEVFEKRLGSHTTLRGKFKVSWDEE